MMPATEIAAALNLRPMPGRREWRGACPACGYSATLVLTETEDGALWWCASCQDRQAVTAALRQVMARDWMPPHEVGPCRISAPSPAQKSALARTLWDAARPHPGTPVDHYLAVRGLSGVQSAELRFHPDARHPGGSRMPAMIAAIRDTLSGEVQAVHRTYLRPGGGGKAAMEPAKASLGPVTGGAVILDAINPGVPLVIGEGIETSLSAARMIGGAAWCAVSAGNLIKLRLPDHAQDVIVAADADAPGQRAAEVTARRWQAEGRRVRIATPDRSGLDFNDLLCALHTVREASRG